MHGFTHPPGEWRDPPYQFLGDVRRAGGTIAGAVSAVRGDGLIYDGSQWINCGQVRSINDLIATLPDPRIGTSAEP
jgi:hypothetical protein